MRKPKYYRMFSYEKSLLPNKYIAELEEMTKDLDEAKEITGFSVGYPGWNLLYYTLLCSLREEEFNTILETGTNYGFSTIILGQALKDSRYDGIVHSVEIEKDYFEKAKKNVSAAGVSDKICLHNQDSIGFLKTFKPENNKISYAFLDGCHDEQHVLKEFEIIYEYIDQKTIVFFDNTYLLKERASNRRVNGALREIKRKYGGNIINFENTSWHTPGQAIWQKDAFLEDWQ